MPDLPANPSSVLVLDGAMGTELGRRGSDVGLPLWSARALIETPAMVEAVHREYLEAGADAIITNTFRTHARSLAKADRAGEAAALTRRAVELARSARDAAGRPDALVLGSVAPLEDCYHPEHSPSRSECHHEHAQMIRQLLDAGADFILVETMSMPHEAAAAASEASRLAPGRWMMSFLTRHHGPPGTLLHGESYVDLLPDLEDAAAVGVNCVAAEAVEGEVKLLRAMLPERVRVLAYANVGHQEPSGEWVNGDATDPERFAEVAMTWVSAGATLVGGCCGTTPATIHAVSRRVTGEKATAEAPRR